MAQYISSAVIPHAVIMMAACVSDRDNYWSETLVDIAISTFMQIHKTSMSDVPYFIRKIVIWVETDLLMSDM